MGQIRLGGGTATHVLIIGGVFLALAALAALSLAGWFSQRAVPALGPQLALAAPVESHALRSAADKHKAYQEMTIGTIGLGEARTAITSERRPPRQWPATPEELRLQDIRSLSSLIASQFPDTDTVLRETIARAMVDIGGREGVDPRLLYAVIHLESRFKPNAVGAAGEIGLMQIMPSTARLVVKNQWGTTDFDPNRLYDPVFNIEVGTIHLGYLLEIYDGDVGKALTAYNTGSARNGLNTYARVVLGTYEDVTTDEAAGSLEPGATTAAVDTTGAGATTAAARTATTGTREAHAAAVNRTRR